MDQGSASSESQAKSSDDPENTVFVPRRIDVPDDPFGDSYDDKRLWIGNLDTRMTEYAVLKMVQKFGAIRKMDFIYHKGGPDKGKSKGYCFVSFHSWEVAEDARKGLDGRWVMGRPLYAKWAHSSKYDEEENLKKESKKASSSNPTSSSISSSASLAAISLSSDATPNSKIRAIEAKLRMMEESQQEFGLNHVIKPPPGGVPVNLLQRQDGQRSQRGHPYKRNQNSRPRSRR